MALEPSQVLQEAWQARQVPEPRYIPGMHSLVVVVEIVEVEVVVLAWRRGNKGRDLHKGLHGVAVVQEWSQNPASVDVTVVGDYTS